jgi:hypothetical protein
MLPGKRSLRLRIGGIFTLRNGLVAILLVLYPFLVLSYRLQQNPPGFFIDESIYGFEAYSILTTGGFSSSGVFLPRLFDSGHGVYAYLIVPFIGMLGVTEISVRLVSVLISVSLLVVLYLLMRNRVSVWSILLIALWWPLTSWVFLLSRIGMEMIAFALFSTLGMWLIIKFIESTAINDLHIYLFDALVVMLFFIYAAGKVVALGYMILALVIFIRKRVPNQSKMKLMLAPVATLLLCLPYILDGTILYRYNELSKNCTIGIFNCLIRNLASHFRYSSYFANTYIPPDFKVPTHSIVGTSLIPRPLSIFLLIGLLVWLNKLLKREPLAVITLAVIVMGIIPASLTIRGFDSYRSIALLPIIFIITMLGLDACIWIIRRMPSPLRVLVLVAYLFATVFLGGQEVKKLVGYEYQENAARWWHFGYRQILNYFTEHYDEYDAFIVTEKVAYLPSQYIRFFDPEGVYNKIRIGTKSDVEGNPKVLFAARPAEFDLAKFKIHKVIYYPNGHSIAFYIGAPLPPVDKTNKEVADLELENPPPIKMRIDHPDFSYVTDR